MPMPTRKKGRPKRGKQLNTWKTPSCDEGPSANHIIPPAAAIQNNENPVKTMPKSISGRLLRA